MTEIILASQSARRRELMAQAGYTFTVHPAGGEEILRGESPEEMVENLSLQKAMFVAGELQTGELSCSARRALVIGADTIVAADNTILGKPADREEAAQMIRMLQGRIHRVYTGVTLVLTEDGGIIRSRTFHECTEVEVYEMTEEEISGYTATPEPYDKAGAYGIQGSFGVFIRGIKGCYYNVVGLPIARLRHEIEKGGFLQ